MITPDVPGIPGVTPDPRVAHLSPLKQKRREGHLVVKNGNMHHQLTSMGLTPPSHGLDPSCVEHGGKASTYIK